MQLRKGDTVYQITPGRVIERTVSRNPVVRGKTEFWVTYFQVWLHLLEKNPAYHECVIHPDNVRLFFHTEAEAVFYKEVLA